MIDHEGLGPGPEQLTLQLLYNMLPLLVTNVSKQLYPTCGPTWKGPGKSVTKPHVQQLAAVCP